MGVAVAFEHQPQPVQGQVPVEPRGVCRSGSSSGRGVPGGDHRHIVATETVDVLADAADQPVDQACEPEHRTGLHAFDGVLADDRPRPGQLHPSQRGRPCRGRIGGHLDTGRDRPAEELALGRHHVDTIDDPKSTTIAAEPNL